MDDLVQDCSNSSVLAMELLQSCAMPLIYNFEENFAWIYLVTARFTCPRLSDNETRGTGLLITNDMVLRYLLQFLRDLFKQIIMNRKWIFNNFACNGCMLLSLTHCGLVSPHGVTDLSYHWFRQWMACLMGEIIVVIWRFHCNWTFCFIRNLYLPVLT